MTMTVYEMTENFKGDTFEVVDYFGNSMRKDVDFYNLRSAYTYDDEELMTIAELDVISLDLRGNILRVDYKIKGGEVL